MCRKQLPNDESESSPERESASVRHLDKQYSGSYRRWRLENKGGYGFFYHDIRNEYTYQDGKGFIRDVPEYSERCALHNVNRLISCIMLFYLLFNTLSVYIIPAFLSSAFGVNIGVDLTQNAYYGDETTIIVYNYITSILKKLIPAALIGIITGMPMKVMIPVRTSNKPLFGTAIPSALLVAATGSVMVIPMKNFFSYMHAELDLNLTISSDSYNMTALIILSVIISPILSEIFVHGACLQLLRQFGDGYALMITGLITAMTSDDIRLFLYFYMVSVVIGYFTLRTGSVITAIVMRMTVSGFFYIQSFLGTISDEHRSATCVTAFVIFCLVVGLIFVVRFMIVNNHKISLPLKATYLSPYDKMMSFFTTPSVILWLAASFAVMICSIPLDL
ncbi:MAG: type II CAAX prenyl endopeptidase Rce1 family protein [Oscillospiraceae bacterium]